MTSPVENRFTGLVEIGRPVQGVEEKEHGGEGDKEEDVSLARSWIEKRLRREIHAKE